MIKLCIAYIILHKMKDPLYFHRPAYAAKLVSSLKDGITHAFTLFAPRRMGKTQFLLKDVAPLAEQQGFNVLYFSFMDATNPDSDFQAALFAFAQHIATGGKAKSLIAGISKIEVWWCPKKYAARKNQAASRQRIV